MKHSSRRDDHTATHSGGSLADGGVGVARTMGTTTRATRMLSTAAPDSSWFHSSAAASDILI